MKNYGRKNGNRAEQVKVFNSSGNKDLHRMNQEIMLKRLVNYQDDDTIAKKINKFFSIFF